MERPADRPSDEPAQRHRGRERHDRTDPQATGGDVGNHGGLACPTGHRIEVSVECVIAPADRQLADEHSDEQEQDSRKAPPDAPAKGSDDQGDGNGRTRVACPDEGGQ